MVVEIVEERDSVGVQGVDGIDELLLLLPGSSR